MGGIIMKIHCRYIVKHKDIDILEKKGIIYKCVLGNTLLRTSDLKEKWACNGCLIPRIMNNRPCKYLKPYKNFLIRGSSQTWFSCELLDLIMDLPDFCKLKCKLYESNNIF